MSCISRSLPPLLPSSLSVFHSSAPNSCRLFFFFCCLFFLMLCNSAARLIFSPRFHHSAISSAHRHRLEEKKGKYYSLIKFCRDDCNCERDDTDCRAALRLSSCSFAAAALSRGVRSLFGLMRESASLQTRDINSVR